MVEQVVGREWDRGWGKEWSGLVGFWRGEPGPGGRHSGRGWCLQRTISGDMQEAPTGADENPLVGFDWLLSTRPARENYDAQWGDTKMMKFRSNRGKFGCEIRDA